MTPAKMRIDYLANHPELADELAALSWNEWQSIYQHRGQNFADAVKNYRQRINIDRLPLALVALADRKLIGTVSLKYYDLDIRPDIKIWLGGLFVMPEWRRRGVGSLLMERAMEAAKRLNLEKLFLWTSSAENLYLKLGWRPVERLDYCDSQIVIMEKNLTEAFAD